MEREREREMHPCLLKMATDGRQDRHGNTHKATNEQLPKDSPHVTFHNTWVTGLEVVSWEGVPAKGFSVLALRVSLEE